MLFFYGQDYCVTINYGKRQERRALQFRERRDSGIITANAGI
jgi:hypothetical protein